MTRNRLRTLIIYKQHVEEGISKYQMAPRTGIDPASALKWPNPLQYHKLYRLMVSSV